MLIPQAGSRRAALAVPYLRLPTEGWICQFQLTSELSTCLAAERLTLSLQSCALGIVSRCRDAEEVVCGALMRPQSAGEQFLGVVQRFPFSRIILGKERKTES